MWRLGGHAGQKLEAAVAHIDLLTIEIIRRSDLTGFVILPRHWVVERTCRGSTGIIAKVSIAWMVVSSLGWMTRRIAELELQVGLSVDDFAKYFAGGAAASTPVGLKYRKILVGSR